MPRKIWVAVVVLITLFLLATGSGCRLFGQDDESVPETDTEDDIKSFTASALFSGELLHFPDDFLNQAVYLLFFADG